ncbi:MAG: hypothetical protein ACTHXF_11715 [Brevibacterium yomogidense]
MNPTEMTDEEIVARLIELDTERDPLLAERARRRRVADLEARMEEAQVEWFVASGREQGENWIQPTGYHNAYPLGWTVTHDGKEWVSLTPANVWEPGVSGWREAVEDGGVPEWVRPTGTHDAYQLGDRVTFEGAVYESTMDGNVWPPADHPDGWQQIGDPDA